MRDTKNTVIEVDADYAIEVDSQNWVVYYNAGKTWQPSGYCRDLPAALNCIIRHKTDRGKGSGSIKRYLDWYNSNAHAILDRVLRKDKELKAALETNKVVVSPNNFN